MTMASYQHEDGTWEEWDDGEDELEVDCGMMPDGQCSMAGTEWCDWDCPRSRSRAALEAARADPNQMDLGL